MGAPLQSRRILRDASGRERREATAEFRFADPTGRQDPGLPRHSLFLRRARRRGRRIAMCMAFLTAAALSGLALWGYLLGRLIVWAAS